MKKQTGITLIGLIITIIVMLILLAVVVYVAYGRQGIINNALGNARIQKDHMVGFLLELENYNRRIWRFKNEWHRKLAMPFACLVFFFIGAPLGAIIRKGGLGTPVIVAILFYVFYHVISMIGDKAAKTGVMTPFEGMWLSAFVILAIGIFLTWMATRDSQIFNIEVYANYIRKGLDIIFVTNRTFRPEIAYVATPSDLAPETMISKLEELSHLCRIYLEGDFRKRLRISTIWTRQDDSALMELAKQYDYIRAVLKQSDVEMIIETVAEYPQAALHDFKIKKISHWHQLAAAVIFPVWFYLYLKSSIQKTTLRRELQGITNTNRNLVNELNSILD